MTFERLDQKIVMAVTVANHAHWCDANTVKVLQADFGSKATITLDLIAGRRWMHRNYRVEAFTVVSDDPSATLHYIADGTIRKTSRISLLPRITGTAVNRFRITRNGK